MKEVRRFRSNSWGKRLKTRMSSIQSKQKSRSLRISSMKRWKYWAPFRRPKNKGNLEKAERNGNCDLLDVDRMNRDLVVSPYKVYFGKGVAAGKTVVVILYV